MRTTTISGKKSGEAARRKSFRHSRRLRQIFPEENPTADHVMVEIPLINTIEDPTNEYKIVTCVENSGNVLLTVFEVDV